MQATPDTVAAAPPPEGQVRLELPCDTLPQLLEAQVKRWPNRPLLIYASEESATSDEIVTYTQFRTNSLHYRFRLTEQIKLLDIKFNDAPIAVLSPNLPELLMLCMGAWYARGSILLLPTSASLEILESLISISTTKVLVYATPSKSTELSESQQFKQSLLAQSKSLAEALKERCPYLHLIPLQSLYNLEAAEERSGEMESYQYKSEGGEGDKTCCVLSTSASTTGTSVKAVPLSHNNLLYSCVSRNHFWEGCIDERDRVLGWLPLFHIMGLLLDFLNTALICGGSYAFPSPHPDLPTSLIRNIHRFQPTLMSTVPWMLVEWRKKIEEELHDDKKNPSDTLDALRSLKALLTGGAPVDDHLAVFFESNGVKLLQSEGMTECSGSLFTGHPTDTSYLTLRMHPSIIYEWIPIDSDLFEDRKKENEKETEEEREEEFLGGELVIVDSPAVTKGYLNNEAANQRAFFWAPPASIPGHATSTTTAPVRKFRTGDVFKILPGSGGRCVQYVCRVDDVLSLSTGEKMNPIDFEQRVRQRTWMESPTMHRLQLINNICLLGRNMPLPFAVIEPDYKAVDEAYANDNSKGLPLQRWLYDILWQAISSVNEGWSSSCRVHREAVIILQRDDEPLKVSRKRQVYRTIAEARFSAEMRRRCDKLLGNQHQQPANIESSLRKNQSELIRIIFESLADVVAVPVETLIVDESYASQPFAALGVTSLLANQLASRLSDKLNTSIPVSTLYTYPTVTQLASFILQTQQPDSIATSTTKVFSRKQNDAVAVIGMSMRFPGGEEGGGYWRVLRDGVDAITEVPPSRWDMNELYHPDSDTPATIHSRKGGFVEDTEYFDHTFFGISAKEALMMDPRQKMALKLVWEALEMAGIPPRSLSGSNTGVFIAAMDAPFQELVTNHSGLNISTLYGTGVSSSAIAGRVSYFLNLKGPSLTMDTACSSSGVAIDTARRYLQDGTCDMAIVCGVHSLLAPASHIFLTKARLLSPLGRCATFDASADGYCRSEGYGTLILERESDASTRDRYIWGLIKGTAVNHNGTSNGMTAPSSIAQRDVMNRALKEAGIAPEDVSFLEAHGTGTVVGDPIEFDAIRHVYDNPTHSGRELYIASGKTNIGHCEPTSGMAGVIKVLLSMHHRQIPPHIHLKQLNPLIEMPSDSRLRIPTELIPWVPHKEDKPLTAAVSTFGFSGTNAHIILQSWQGDSQHPLTTHPPAVGSGGGDNDMSYMVLPFSAQSEESMNALNLRLQEALSNMKNLHSEQTVQREVASLCYTAAMGRTHFHAKRAAVVGGSADELMDGLSLLLIPRKNNPNEEKGNIVALKEDSIELCFSFSGQGTEYENMGKDVWLHCPIFKQALEECERIWQEIMKDNPDRIAGGQTDSLLAVIYPEEGLGEGDRKKASLQATSNVQPALVAFEYALCKQWEYWGVKPSYVMGHSLGEISAALIAGMLSLREALSLAASRGWWMEQTRVAGSMATIFASEETVDRLVKKTMEKEREKKKEKETEKEGVVVIAVVNGPTSVVISGSPHCVRDTLERANEEGLKWKDLHMRCAFHSPLLGEAMEPWLQEAKGILSHGSPSGEGECILISNSTAAAISKKTVREGSHWLNHALGPVLMWPSSLNLIKQMKEKKKRVVFLEIGPSSVLTSIVARGVSQEEERTKEGLKGRTITLPSIVKLKNGWKSMLDAAARLYSLGIDIRWDSLYSDIQKQQAGLSKLSIRPIPTYPFQPIRSCLGPFHSSKRHSIEEERYWVPPDRPHMRYMNWAPNEDELKALMQHSFNGSSILPAASMLGILCDAQHKLETRKKDVNDSHIAHIKELSIFSRVTLPSLSDAKGWYLSYSVDMESLSFHLYDRGGDEGSFHKFVSGSYANSLVNPLTMDMNLSEIRQVCNWELDVSALYHHHLQMAGLDYGPLFQGISHIWSDQQRPISLLARLKVHQRNNNHNGYLPWLVDAALHMAAAFEMNREDGIRTFLPIEFHDVFMKWPLKVEDGTSLWCYHQLIEEEDTQLRTMTVTVWDDNGEVLIRIGRYITREVSGDERLNQLLYAMQWKEMPQMPLKDISLSPKEDMLLTFEDRGGLCKAIGEKLLLHSSNPSEMKTATFASQAMGHSVEDMRKLLKDAVTDDVILRILFGWPLDADGQELMDGITSSCKGLLHLVQALALEGLTHRTHIAVFTHSVADTLPTHARYDSPPILTLCGQSAVHGMVGVMVTEFPELSITLYDIENPGMVEGVDGILSKMVFSKEVMEDRIAIRNATTVWVPRLHRLPPIQHQEQEKAKDKEKEQEQEKDTEKGGVLITGGYGGIGRELCKWMILEEENVSTIFLVGRSLPMDPYDWLDSLLTGGEEKGGASHLAILKGKDSAKELHIHRGEHHISVHFLQGDVAEAGQVCKIFDTIRSHHSDMELSVYHCAGVLRDHTIPNLQWEAFEEVMKPKALGAQHILSQCSQSQMRVKEIVLFSSVSNILGTPGQANYTASNGVVEGLAVLYRRKGIPVRAIQWGLWGGIGMAASSSHPPSSSMGLHALPMTPYEALSAMQLSPHTHPCICISAIDWRVSHSLPLRVSLWKELAIQPTPTQHPPQQHPQQQDVESLLHSLICDVLAMDVRTSIGEDVVLAEYGMDSMGGMELRASLAQQTGVWLPLKAFRAPTKRSILTAYHNTPQQPQQQLLKQPQQPQQKVSVKRNTKKEWRYKWLDYVGGDEDGPLRMICFGDAGGDPANFGSWVSILSTVGVYAVHWPHHTTRSEEPSCPSIPQGAALFLEELQSFLEEKPYVMFGQCIGAWYAFRFIQEIRSLTQNKGRLPSMLLCSACPGPTNLDVLTELVRNESLYEGLKTLSLAIGWTEEEWIRFSSNTLLYNALVGDVSMADPPKEREEPPLDVPITVIWGDQDPVVKRHHMYSWIATTTAGFRLEVMPGLGHNIHFEPVVISKVRECIATLGFW